MIPGFVKVSGGWGREGITGFRVKTEFKGQFCKLRDLHSANSLIPEASIFSPVIKLYVCI